MITSKQIIQLSEKYYNSFNISGKDVVLDLNPTLDDYKKLKFNDLRFIADSKTKNVVVWNGLLAIHLDVAKKYGVSFNSLYSGQYLCGLAYFPGKSLPMIHCDANASSIIYGDKNKLKERVSYLTNLFSHDWSWVDKFIIGTGTYMKETAIIFHEKLK
jgi:hypothetical protein